MKDLYSLSRRFAFLGSEFLTWLWYAAENDPSVVEKAVGEGAFLTLSDRVVLEKKFRESVERVTIRGEGAEMDEGLLALKKGGAVAEATFEITINNENYRFAIKAEGLAVSGLKTPAVGSSKDPEELSGAIIEKAGLIRVALDAIDKLYASFLQKRTTGEWKNKVLPAMAKWAENREEGA